MQLTTFASLSALARRGGRAMRGAAGTLYVRHIGERWGMLRPPWSTGGATAEPSVASPTKEGLPRGVDAYALAYDVPPLPPVMGALRVQLQYCAYVARPRNALARGPGPARLSRDPLRLSHAPLRLSHAPLRLSRAPLTPPCASHASLLQLYRTYLVITH